MNFSKFTHLTFDCYGTLIDWEKGILNAVLPVLEKYGVQIDEADVVRLYARAELAEESGPFKKYRDVLRGVMIRIGNELGFAATKADCNALAYSAESWPPFSDTIEALDKLKQRYKLVILSNIDDEIFQQTSRVLGHPFDQVITAEQAGSYKPSLNNFRLLLDRLNVPQEKILHVAQSLYHDHAPAKELGLSTVWINRLSCVPNVGVAPPSNVKPDFEAPDLSSLVVAMGL